MTDHSLLELLLDHATMIPVLVVRAGRIVRSSPSATELLSASPELPVDGLFDERSQQKLAEAIAAAPTSCELQARLAGELVTLRVAVLPMDSGEWLLIVVRIGTVYADSMAQQLLTANDHLANLTRELARRSAELEAARRQFEALAELREHFISMLAHDVHGALQVVLLSADAIERGQQGGRTEIVEQGIDRVRRSSTRIRALVEKVLEAARTEAPHMVLDARPVSLGAVARDAVEIYGPIAEQQGIQLVFVDRSDSDVVPGDHVRLGQVAGNLIENAVRHSPNGGTVTVELSSEPAVVRIAVRDQGPGIRPELRERIFERFVQGPGKGGSLGLGLYVARQLVELHHGRVYVEDVVPHGAALIVEPPRG